MALSQKQIGEINVIITAIEKEVKSGMEIGARDKSILTGLLLANKIEKTPKFFKCERVYSEAIVKHFTKEKELPKNKFSVSAQTAIYLI